MGTFICIILWLVSLLVVSRWSGRKRYKIKEEVEDKKTEQLLKRVKKAEDERDKLLKALCFYADSDNYFAISFFPDPPCGGFMDDFSDDHEGDFDRKMPGALARKALREIRTV